MDYSCKQILLIMLPIFIGSAFISAVIVKHSLRKYSDKLMNIALVLILITGLPLFFNNNINPITWIPDSEVEIEKHELFVNDNPDISVKKVWYSYSGTASNNYVNVFGQHNGKNIEAKLTWKKGWPSAFWVLDNNGKYVYGYTGLNRTGATKDASEYLDKQEILLAAKAALSTDLSMH